MRDKDNYIHFTNEEIESTDHSITNDTIIIDGIEYWKKGGTATGFNVVEK